MLRLRQTKPVALVTFLLLILLMTACSPSAVKLNKQGNEEYAREAYTEAFAAYESAQFESPEIAESYYNAANVLYRQGAYQEALSQLQQALRLADDESLAERSYFNMGNTAYESQDWQDAVASYTQSLLRNPSDQDAKYNLELALQQKQQQDEQQDEAQQQEQNPDQQQGKDQAQTEQENQKEDQGQGQGDEQTQNQQAQNQSPADNEQSQEEQQSDQSGDQSQSEGSQSEGQDQDPAQDQSQPSGSDERNPGQAPGSSQEMTAEQAKQLLAALAREGQTLQEKLGQIFVVPPHPPVQDW
jgi:Ca-activated chloride channel family protein